MNDFQKNMEQFIELMKASMPQVKANKNGYEIRTKVLDMAQNQVWQDYHAKWGTWSVAVEKNDTELVAKVDIPAVPGAEQVLETAQKFYDFINNPAKAADKRSDKE
jgi:hypothetical protein